MKKLLSVLLALTMLLSLVPAAVAEVDAEIMDALNACEALPETLENPNLTMVFWMSWNGYRNQVAKNPAVYEASLEAKAAFEENINRSIRQYNPDYWRARQSGIEAAKEARRPRPDREAAR